MRRALAVLLGLCAAALLPLTLYALAWAFYGPSMGMYSSDAAWIALATALGTGLTAWGAVLLWKGRSAVDARNTKPGEEGEV